MKRIILGLGLMLALSCKPVDAPTADAEAGQPPSVTQTIEAGTAIINNGCTLIEGVDSNGVLRTICGTAEEVAQLVSFITTLRLATDAGVVRGSTGDGWSPIPTTTFYTTSAERAKAILYVSSVRDARLKRDGGAK